MFTEFISHFTVTDANNKSASKAVTWKICPRYRDIILADSPCAYYPLDETSGTVAHDISGNGYHGTWHGSPDLAGTEDGLVATDTDHSAKFDGSNDMVDVRVALAALTAIAYSFECWINVQNTSGQVFMDARGPQHEIMQFGFLNGAVHSWSGHSTDGPDVLPRGVYHMAMTVSSARTITIYLNGNPVCTGSVEFDISAAGELVLGYRLPVDDRYVQGRMAHCAFYDRALTADEIATHYAAGASGA